MITKEVIIWAAILAYPDADLLGVDMEKISMPALLGAARKNRFGDRLLGFIVLELNEGFEVVVGRKERISVERGVHLMDRAIRDVEAVRDAIARLRGGSPRSEG
jgi:hypothetical protein